MILQDKVLLLQKQYLLHNYLIKINIK